MDMYMYIDTDTDIDKIYVDINYDKLIKTKVNK